MKLQKSIITLAIAATLSASVFTLPALAADNTQASTQFTYTKQNDPTYTVSIPSSLSLTDEGTPLTITASDVAYLNGKKVSVTIAGTNYYRNQLVLSAKTSKPSYTDTIRYQLIGPSNYRSEYRHRNRTCFLYRQRNRHLYGQTGDRKQRTEPRTGSKLYRDYDIWDWACGIIVDYT